MAPQALADAASTDPLTTPDHAETQSGDEVWNTNDFDIDMTGFEELMETLPLHSGIDNTVFLDSLWTGYGFTV